MSEEQNNRKIVEIWQSCKPRIASLCKNKMKSCPGEIEDLMSDVFMAFLHEVRTKAMPRNPYAWLLKVTNNHIKQRYTKINKEKEMFEKVDFENNNDINLQFNCDFTDEMIDDMDIENLKEDLLAKLSESERELIIFVCEDKLKLKEIAMLLNTTENAVKQKYYRTSSKVKELARSMVESFK